MGGLGSCGEWGKGRVCMRICKVAGLEMVFCIARVGVSRWTSGGDSRLYNDFVGLWLLSLVNGRYAMCYVGLFLHCGG